MISKEVEVLLKEQPGDWSDIDSLEIVARELQYARYGTMEWDSSQEYSRMLHAQHIKQLTMKNDG